MEIPRAVHINISTEIKTRGNFTNQ